MSGSNVLEPVNLTELHDIHVGEENRLLDKDIITDEDRKMADYFRRLAENTLDNEDSWGAAQDDLLRFKIFGHKGAGFGDPLVNSKPSEAASEFDCNSTEDPRDAISAESFSDSSVDEEYKAYHRATALPYPAFMIPKGIQGLD